MNSSCYHPLRKMDLGVNGDGTVGAIIKLERFGTQDGKQTSVIKHEWKCVR